MKITAKIPPQYNAKEILWFFSRGYKDLSFTLLDHKIRKAVLWKEHPILLELTIGDHQLELEALLGSEYVTKSDLEQYLEQWIEIKTDLNPFYKLCQENGLSQLVDDFSGLRIIGIPSLFESLAWSIIGQQINLNFAYSLKKKFIELYGKNLIYQDQTYYIFPTFEVVYKIGTEQLINHSFSGQKRTYLLAIADKFYNNQIDNDLLVNPEVDLDAKIKHLTQIKGVGHWTASYSIMKSFLIPEAYPLGDVGINNALFNYGLLSDKKDFKQVKLFYDLFKGYEAYLTFYLWRSLSGKLKEEF